MLENTEGAIENWQLEKI